MANEIEDSNRAIEQLIRLLENAASQLDTASRQFQNLTNIISNLKNVSQEAINPDFISRINEAISAIDRLEGKRVNIPGAGRFRTASFGEESVLGGFPTEEEVNKNIARMEELQRKVQDFEARWQRRGVFVGKPYDPAVGPQADIGGERAAEEARARAQAAAHAMEATVRNVSNVYRQLGDALRKSKISPEAIDEIIAKVQSLGISFTDLAGKVRIVEGAKGLDSLNFTLNAGDDAARRFKVQIDSLTGSIANLESQAKKPDLRALLSQELRGLAVPRPVRQQVIPEIAGAGLDVSKISNIRYEPIERAGEAFQKLTVSLRTGEAGVATYTRFVNEMGQVLTTIPRKIQEVTVSQAELNRVLGTDVSDKALKVAQSYGFQADQLKKVTTEGSTGISRLVFTARQADGVFKTLGLSVDRFGNVLVDTQKRFRGFTESIIRNIGEGFKWTVAIGLIYGPLRKLQELITLAIDNETKLADIAIVLGEAHTNLSQVFNDAAEAARATGESLNGVIEGYALAYRATGSIEDANERARISQQLLIDSLVLSKLSAFEQAQAMDVLVGALGQLNLPLDQGQQLLNSWVAVSKNANVSVEALAQTFAITSTTAVEAGLSIHELNGLVAALGKNFSLSATEAGNAARAIISSLQTEGAQKELYALGIAVEDLQTGQIRPFLDVLDEISDRFRAGLVSDRELQKLSQVLGGGVRRGAQVQAIIKDLASVRSIAEISAEAEADAYEALEVQLETVRTSLTNLGTSFQQLAQALGQEGGLTDILQTTLDIATLLVDSLTAVVEQLGRATPYIAAIGGALAYAGATGRLPFYQQQLGGAAAGIAGRVLGQGRPTTQFTSEGQITTTTGAVAAQSFGKNVARFAPFIGAGIAEAFMAAMNLQEGDIEGLWGQVIGGALGFAAGGPYGAIIGSLIGESFVGIVSANAEDLGDKLFREAEPTADEPGKPEEELTQADLDKILTKAAGGAFVVGLVQKFTQLQATLGRGAPVLEPRGAALGLASLRNPEELQRYLELQQRFNLRTGTEGGGIAQPITPFSEEVVREAQRNADLINGLLEEQEQRTREALVNQEINAKKYRETLETIQGAPELIAQALVAMGDTGTVAIEDLTDVIVNGSEEQRVYITQLVGEIQILTNELDKASRGIAVDIDTDEARREVVTLQTLLDDFLNKIIEVSKVSQVQLPDVVNLEDFDATEVALIIQRALENQQEFFQKAISEGIIPDDATAAAIIDAYNQIFLRVAEGGYQALRGLGSQFISQAQKELEAEDIISSKADKFGIRQFDVTQAQFQSAYASALAFVQQRFPEYEIDPQRTGAIFKDNVTDVLHLDNLVTQLALQELIDVSKKQLDGIYNLPAGASFFVPFQGYRLGFNNQGGGAGGFAGGTEQVETRIDRSNTLLERIAHNTEGAGGRGEARKRPYNYDEILAERRAIIERAQERYRVDQVIQRQQEQPAAQTPFTGPYEPVPQQPFDLGRYLEQAAQERAIEERKILEETIGQPLTKFIEGFGGSVGDFAGNIADALGSALQSALQAVFGKPEDIDTTTRGVEELSTAISGLDKAPSTNLSLDLNSTTQLVVDGAVLASVLKTYLYEDLLRFEGTSGSINRTIAI